MDSDLYGSEMNWKTIISIFTVIGMVIGCSIEKMQELNDLREQRDDLKKQLERK